ncbi:FtsW/RodA/SpoVE family cell cycle protein [Patescibacteria group bacterium]|nr:FtsW/RodA/SpoVE family cell cycle protein [Patescibacteria group bacterium]
MKQDNIHTFLQKRIILVIGIISVFGLIMVFDTSLGLYAQRYHYIMLQTIWFILGSIVAFVLYHINYKIVEKFSLLLIIIVVILLILVIFTSHAVNGSTRWFTFLNFVNVQPSEFAKIFFITYIAYWITRKKNITKEYTTFKENFKLFLLPYLLITSALAGLIVLEKDLGTAIIIVSISILILFSTDHSKFAKLNIVTVGIYFFILALISIVVEPYRLQRLLTYLSKGKSSITSAGYQIHQILLTLGSGGLLGVGFTQSVQKNQYLVGNTSITDSIFAIIAEELGFITALLLILLYLYLIYLIFKVSINSKNFDGKIIAAGIGFWIAVQVFVNISANIGVLPLTGVPLPLISYGGSSIIAFFIAFGILLNINRNE